MSAAGGTGGLPPPRFLIDALWVRRLAGAGVLGGYVRLVRATSRLITRPVDYASTVAALEPAIFVAWHANALAVPLLIPTPSRTVVMSSPHPDGMMSAAFVESFGMSSIIGTGVSFKQSEGTGGVAGFRSMLRALRDGRSVYLSAEIPPEPGRNVSRGVIALARKSGRPIVPIAAASSRRTIVQRLWDKMQVNHPFSRIALLAGEPRRIGDDVADDEAQAALKRDLDALYADALARADAAS